MKLGPPSREVEGFDAVFGLELVAASDELVRGRLEVSDELKQPAGVVRGGVFASIAEALATLGTTVGVRTDGKRATGLSTQTSFLRPVTTGAIDALATRRHRGRTTWVWEVEMTDDEGRLCALTRITIAVR